MQPQRTASSRRGAAGVEEAGGVPLEFNTIAVSDNQTQGTPGMRASLVSRELIADSIELMDVAHDFDALVGIVGCDKTVPAALMALARIDKPAVVIYSGPMRAGRWRGGAATILEVWEAVGAHGRAGSTAKSWTSSSASRAPAPAPAPASSRRTRWASRSSSSGSRRSARPWSPADDATAPRGARARRARSRSSSRAPARRERLPRPPRARNAMAGIAATGGSTNGLLHLLAIAREAGVELDLDDLSTSAPARR